MIDYYEVKVGQRVLDRYGFGRLGTIIHVFTGSLDGAVEVTWDDGTTSIERSYTLISA